VLLRTRDYIRLAAPEPEVANSDHRLSILRI
jgi:hypothetical protein